MSGAPAVQFATGAQHPRPLPVEGSVGEQSHSADPHVVPLEVFSAAWAVHTNQLAWFMGAGVSAAAGVPTATAVRDELLVGLYARSHNLVRQSLDRTDPVLIQRVRAYFDGQNGLPPIGDPSDYSKTFELAMPDPETRRQHIRKLFAGKEPCFGQDVLGALVAAGSCDVMVTTNFDDLIERATQAAQGPEPGRSGRVLNIAALSSTQRAVTALQDLDWPLLVKLHGDFRERSLMNIQPELREQNGEMLQFVSDLSRGYGLVVAGYSGRDESVMRMLATTCDTPNAWPRGVWWLARDPDEIAPEVLDLLATARANGINAYLVRAGTFDETMGSLSREAHVQATVRTYLDELRPRERVTQAARLTSSREWPVLRHNALPILQAEFDAVRVPLRGTWSRQEFRSALRDASWRGTAVLGPGEVIALGDADSLQRALGADRSDQTRLTPLDVAAPRHHHAMLLHSIAKGVASRLPVGAQLGGNGASLLVTKVRPDEVLARSRDRDALEMAYASPTRGQLSRSYGLNRDGGQREWGERVELSIDWQDGHAWLLFLPTTWVERLHTEDGIVTKDAATDWRTQRWAQRRFNAKWVPIIDTWVHLIAPTNPTSISLAPASGASRRTRSDTGDRKVERDDDARCAGNVVVGQISAFSEPNR
jgi:hypothetical protein